MAYRTVFYEGQGRSDKDDYGKYYEERKELETRKNDSGGNRDETVKILESKAWRKGTDSYNSLKSGKLPKAHIDARARRYATKLFISHWHYVAYVLKFKKDPPSPYVIQYMGHHRFIPPPHFSWDGKAHQIG